MTLYAHSPYYPTQPYQPLHDHLTQVGKLAAGFLYKFDPLWGIMAGMTHDLGKACPEWQEYLIAVSRDGRSMKSPGHDFQGAVYHYMNNNIPLACMVAGHHRGLRDVNPEHSEFDFKGTLANPVNQQSCKEAQANLGEATFGWPSKPKLPSWIKTNHNMDMFIRMGFSALVDADRLDTETYSAQSGDFSARYRMAARESFPSLSLYGPILTQHINSKSNAFTPVNILRSQVVRECRNAAEYPPGAYTLTVPTGGGKTLSSLEFAFIHAAKWGHKRIIIALPYTSITDQTSYTFRNVFNTLGEDVVLEHQSNLAPEKETPATRVSAENWDAPLIVTTQVQLFDSLFSNHPRECRKLHRLQDSIIILDEVQTLSTKYVTPILDVIQELISNYGVTVLLTTATQPSLGKTSFFPGLTLPPKEIISKDFQVSLWEGLKRVQTFWPGQWNCPDELNANFWTELSVKILAEGPSSLTICHLKKHSRKLYKAISAIDPTVLHLSASMCPTHRRYVLAEVKRRLAAGLPCRLVSTQVIEAGVDIDFPVVFRAMAGLESLAQSAGRCNREGKLPHLGRFFIFIAPEPPPGNLAYNLATAKALITSSRTLPDLFVPETFVRYFEALYLGRGASGLDKEGIQLQRENFNFMTVARSFRLIADLTSTVVIPYDAEAKRLIRILTEEGPSFRLLRKLQPYTVNVYPQQLEKLMEYGQILRHKGIYSMIEDSSYYDADFGIYIPEDDTAQLQLLMI